MKLQLIKVSERRTVPATLIEDVPLSSMGASVVRCSGGKKSWKEVNEQYQRSGLKSR